MDDDALRAALARGSPVEDADLTGLDLRGAVATAGGPVVLRRCRLDAPDLHGLDLTRAVLEQCTVTEANLSGAVLDAVHLVGGVLTDARCTDADLTDAVFDTVDLSRIQLAGALLTDTRFDACRMIGADLGHVRGLAVTFTVDGSNLQLANLQDAPWRGVRLRGVDLSEADLRGADLSDAVLVGCRMRDVDLSHTRVRGTDLRGADLGALGPDSPRQLHGAVISTAQAADVCRALELVVVD